MPKKLTLSINETIIDEAKKYAKSQGRSLSNLIEEYLKSLTKKKKSLKEDDYEISPLVKSLWGSVKTLPENTDYEDILKDEILKKHLL